MLQALLNPPNPDLNNLSLVKPALSLPQEVIDRFAGHPNRFLLISANTTISTTGRGPNGVYDSIQEHEIPEAVKAVQRSMQLAATKSEWEEDVNIAKREGREPRFKGFDGVRLVITDIKQESDGSLIIEVAKTTYSYRAAIAKVANAIRSGEMSVDALILNGKICQANEFHAGSIMFLSSGEQVAQVKGLADGNNKIHLHLSGGGVELAHLDSSNAVAKGNEAELEEEVGDVARFGLKAYVIGKGDERLQVTEDAAITNYAGIIHELRGPDSNRISKEQMIQLAHEQFKKFSLEKLASGESKGVHLWEVIGYPLIDYRMPNSFTIEEGKLFIECEVIRPSFTADGIYDKAELVKERLEVQDTIAPQITYYSTYFDENVR